MPVQWSEEATLLSPNQLFLLVTHAYKVCYVNVRNRHHRDSVVIVDQRNLLTELTVLDPTADAAGAAPDFETFKSAFEESLNAVDIEAFFLLGPGEFIIACRVVDDPDLPIDGTGNGIEVTFVDA